MYERGGETDRQTGRQTDRHTQRQTDGQAGRQTDRQTDRQTETERQTDIEGYGETEKETERERQIQKVRETDRQRQTDRQTEREGDRDREELINFLYAVGLGAVGDEDDSLILDKPPAIRNMSSWAIQPLICPLQLRRNDLVIWYKDGQPIPSDSEDTTTAHSTNTSAYQTYPLTH